MAEDKRHVGAKAQRQAVAKLISHHQDEYDQILGAEREALGLPKVSVPQKKMSRLDILRQQLREAGVEPTI